MKASKMLIFGTRASVLQRDCGWLTLFSWEKDLARNKEKVEAVLRSCVWSKSWPDESPLWRLHLDHDSFASVRRCFQHLVLYICTHNGQTSSPVNWQAFLSFSFCRFFCKLWHISLGVESEASLGSFVSQCGSICLVALICPEGPIYWLICPGPLLMWRSVCFSRWNIQIRPKEKRSAGRPAGALWRLARLPNIRFGSCCFFRAQALALHQQKKDVLSVSFF